MKYNILNNYIYDNKSYFLATCDWLSNPLRVALGGKTVQIASGREEQDNRIWAIVLCCFAIPILLGAVSLLLKSISYENVLLDGINTQNQNNSSPPSSSLMLLNDQPFISLYFPRLPALTFEPEEPIAEAFVDHIFEEFQEKPPTEAITILPDPNGDLYVQRGETRKTLKDIIEHIDWRNLESHWSPLSVKTQSYLQKSLLFEQLRDPSISGALSFDRPYPFLHLYTSNGFYAIVNSLLRKGQLHCGRLPYASQEIDDLLTQNDPHTISKIVKEVLFISMMMTGNLCHLPDNYLAKEKVTRISYIPRAVLDAMVEGQIIADRGFLSASAAGGGFAGGDPCDESSVRIRYTITPKYGKHVKDFSDLPENEVLFIPFSWFKIISRTGDEHSGFKVEMEEV